MVEFEYYLKKGAKCIFVKMKINITKWYYKQMPKSRKKELQEAKLISIFCFGLT